jgi:hypothetical protein
MTNGKRDSEVKVSEQKKINSWEVVKKWKMKVVKQMCTIDHIEKCERMSKRRHIIDCVLLAFES